MADEPILQKPITFQEFREYYRHFCIAWWQHLFRLVVEQVVGVLIAFVTLLVQIYMGLIPKSLTLKTLASVGWPYLGLAAVFLAWSALRTPVALQKAAPYIRQKDRQIESLRERLTGFSNDEKSVIRFILDNGIADYTNLLTAGFQSALASETVRKAKGHALIFETRTPPVGRIEELAMPRSIASYQVNPALEDALRTLLY